MENRKSPGDRNDTGLREPVWTAITSARRMREVGQEVAETGPYKALESCEGLYF